MSPFVQALGADFDDLAPTVRDHLRQAAGASLLRGRMRKGWRRGGPLGWFLARALHLDFRDLDPTAVFELRNQLLPGDKMLWRRTLRTGRRTIDNVGVMRWDAYRGTLIDAIGRRGAIAVELVPRVDGAALVLTSRRQWFARVPLPRRLLGHARVREWEEPGGRVVLELVVHHPWLGDYAGYEVEFEPAGSSQ